MKIKDSDFIKEKLLRDIRFNENTIGKPESIVDSSPSPGKRKDGALNILALMTAYGYFDEAMYEENDTLNGVVKKMIENARNHIDDGAIKL